MVGEEGIFALLDEDPIGQSQIRSGRDSEVDFGCGIFELQD